MKSRWNHDWTALRRVADGSDPEYRGMPRNEPAEEWRNALRRLRRTGEEGSSLMEFALVLPLMMVVLTGAASFCMALYNLQQLGSATASAAQLLGAEAGLISDPCASAASSVAGSLTGWTTSKLTYTLSITDSSGTAHSYGPTQGSGFSCTAGASEMSANEPVTLTVTYSYTWFPILDYSPSSNLTSTESALME
jgi:Flp pilus assembly protein TadG